MAEHRLRILILGGYGTFGSRLARLLADDERLHLIVAGRSLRKAEKLCAGLASGSGREAAQFDRDGDARSQLAALKPDLLVDASGPFQVYGRHPYRIVEACIDQGVHYVDLADGSAFVGGIGEFDAAARQANVFVLSGASTFPVLTAAVLRRLTGEGLSIEHVSGGIAPSPYAGLGLSVIRAIASYGGRPVSRLENGRLRWDYPLTATRRYTVAPPGALPLYSRRFSLIDVPDLRAIPKLWPELKSIWMGAGPVPGILHAGLNALAWLVRLRILPSLLPMAALFHRTINILRWGEHRSGMFIAAIGRDRNGQVAEKSWHLTAEGDDGPFVPAMAAAAIVRLCLERTPPANGARAATAVLELEHYQPWFAAKRIVYGFRQEQKDLPLYPRIVGSAWERLPPAIRAMHASRSGLTAAGEAVVERGRNPLAQLAANVMRFPQAGQNIPVRVRFEAIANGEIWHRDFGGRAFSSVQTAGEGRSRWLIDERFGVLSVALACVIEEGRLRLIVRRWSLFGIPMPMFLSPSGEAFEYEQDGRFHFDVELKAPLLGRLVRYRGWLAPA